MNEKKSKTIVSLMVKKIYPNLQCSNSFIEMMQRIMKSLIQRRHTFPKHNDIIVHSNKWIKEHNPFHITVPMIKSAFGINDLVEHDVHIIEYILAELIELSGNVMMDNQRKRFLPMSVIIALYNDPDLKQLIDVSWYIPTLAELKQLGGARWAVHFMSGVDPYTVVLSRKTPMALIYTEYTQWYHQKKTSLI